MGILSPWSCVDGLCGRELCSPRGEVGAWGIEGGRRAGGQPCHARLEARNWRGHGAAASPRGPAWRPHSGECGRAPWETMACWGAGRGCCPSDLLSIPSVPSTRPRPMRVRLSVLNCTSRTGECPVLGLCRPLGKLLSVLGSQHTFMWNRSPVWVGRNF